MLYRQSVQRSTGLSMQSDRFIPSRTSIQPCEKLDILDELSTVGNQENCEPELSQTAPHLSYNTLLYNQILGVRDPFTIYQLNGINYAYSNYPFTQKFRMLARKSEDVGSSSENSSGYSLPPCCGFSDTPDIVTPPIVGRKISKTPYKVLDAPALQDDFYLNVVDWSSQGLLAVGLGTAVYIWASVTGKVTKLTDVGPEDSVTSLSWSPKGHYLSIGTQLGMVQLWDTIKCKQIRTLSGHLSRVGSMAWSSQILSTGSRDKRILHRDIRQSADSFAKLQGHKQEVCGLAWSYDEQQLGSGGNDNKVLVWNLRNCEQPSGRFSDHTAAVKALAWSPHQHGLLASGGGTADRTIRFWNTLTNRAVNCIDTGSQVCNLIFSRSVNELVSAHGYSQNNVVIWKYPGMRKLASLSGHTCRVLYMSLGDDGETIVTGAGDETLRFWRVFPPAAKNQELDCSLLVPSGKDLR